LKERINTLYVPHIFSLETPEFSNDDKYATEEEIYLVDLYQKFCEYLPHMYFNLDEIERQLEENKNLPLDA
jgi:hypothetical protein